MTGEPTVSIVVPARDPGPFLHEALASVCRQTFSDWEVVVVDDGSTEDLSWVAGLDPRIRLVRTAPRGVSSARNRGIDETSGALVAFLDADDRWHPHKLDRQVAVMELGAPFSYTAFELVDADGACLGPGYGKRVAYLDMLAGRLGMLQSTVIAQRDALDAAGRYDPQRTLQEDLDLFLRLARAGDGAYLSSVEADYRQHGANASSAYWAAAHALLELYDEHEDLARREHDPAALAAVRVGRRAVKRTYGYQAIDAARVAFHARRWSTSAVALGHAARLSPAAVGASASNWLRAWRGTTGDHDATEHPR